MAAFASDFNTRFKWGLNSLALLDLGYDWLKKKKTHSSSPPTPPLLYARHRPPFPPCRFPQHIPYFFTPLDRFVIEDDTI